MATVYNEEDLAECVFRQAALGEIGHELDETTRRRETPLGKLRDGVDQASSRAQRRRQRQRLRQQRHGGSAGQPEETMGKIRRQLDQAKEVDDSGPFTQKNNKVFPQHLVYE